MTVTKTTNRMSNRIYRLEVERRHLLPEDADVLETIKSKSNVTETADRLIIESDDLFNHLKIQNHLDESSIPYDETA